MESFYTLTIERTGVCETLKYKTLHSVRLALQALGSPYHPERRRGATVTIKHNSAKIATLKGAEIRDIFTSK